MRGRLRPALSLIVAALLALPAAPVRAADVTLGASLRAYLFGRLDSAPDGPHSRRDTEVLIVRGAGDARFDNGWRLNAHGVLTARSPTVSPVTGMADASGPTWLPLDAAPIERRDLALHAGLDRLHVQGPVGPLRVSAGRQAITWGTNHFWPALDLFTPFAPDSVDRDYKHGVDALRLTWPLGAFSEVEAVGAVLGSSLSDDGAAALLARIHLGRSDVGLMGGRFHRDTVVGGFVTGDAGGTGLRAELTYSRSGDDADAARGRARFWRGSAGLDRLLHPNLRVMLEVAGNGFGTNDPARYLSEIVPSDRIARGEITALGRWHAGASLAWEVHPLWTVDNTVLANLGDDSALWVPTARWSTGDETELLFGARVPLGPGPDPAGRARSEYGLTATTVFARFMAYF